MAERSGSFVYSEKRSAAGNDSKKESETEESVSSGSVRKGIEGRIVRGTKAPEIPIFERKNWLIHLHYVRKDFETCKVLAKELLAETDELCEYAMYILGLVSRQEGDLQSSLELFQKAVRLNPNNSASIKQVARSQFLLGHHRVSLETYAEASLLSPKDWEVMHNQGVCSVYLKDYDKAVEYFQQALQHSPQTVTYKELGRTYLLIGALDSALEVYKKAVKFSPEDPDLLTTLGLLHLQLGEPQQAFEALGGALTFDPSHGMAILAAASMMQEHGDYEVALSKYRVAAASLSESPELWNNIGMCNFGRKKFVAAISCLKRATYLAPLEWKVLYNLGLVHLSTQQYASAFHFLRAATSFKPQSGKVYMLLAIALTRLGDTDNAALMYQEALKLEKEEPLIYLNYAVFLYNQDSKLAATHQLKLYNSALRNYKPISPDPEMYDLGNRLAPALQLGEEFAETKPPPPSGDKLKMSVPGKQQVSTVSSESSETTTTTEGGEGGDGNGQESSVQGERKGSILDKTTAVL